MVVSWWIAFFCAVTDLIKYDTDVENPKDAKTVRASF